MILIYFVIMILFVVLFFWVWNNTKYFEDLPKRLKFIIIGLIILGIVTFVIYSISKIGIEYSSKKIEKEVEQIGIFLCIPINGFISLPHIASLKEKIDGQIIEESKIKKRILIFVITIILVIIFEIHYLKNFQNGILQMVNSNNIYNTTIK